MNPAQILAEQTQATTSRVALPELYQSVAEELQLVEHRLQSELRSRSPLVDQVVRHGYRLGGKRLRPALLLLAGQAVSEATLSEDHQVLAAVVEMIHTATLVHDDVLDEADLRRHEETVNARWGNETSVLLGDFLFSHAFYLASTVSAEACRTIGRATNVVCEGELRQTLQEGDLELSEAEYFAIIEAKTAELCACCCELGARQSGADQATIDRLASFGRNLGIAFQIADDLLDLLGEADETGKTTGADLAKRKMTLPLIYTRDTLVNGPRTQFVNLLAKGSTDTMPAIREIVASVDGIASSRRQAADYAARAAADLAALPDGEAKQSLLALATYATARRV